MICVGIESNISVYPGRLFLRIVLNSSIEGTDEIGMLLNFDNSKKILLVDGEANNIKITTKIDLVVATSILEGLN